MAVFPDRIVFKTSRDGSSDIISAIGDNGVDRIVDGEIVLGLEPGKVKLYARDSAGQVVSVLPDPPGYNISGNSIYDLSDVILSAQYQPGNDKVLTYVDGLWVADYLRYEKILGAPSRLDQLDNPNDYYLTQTSSLWMLGDVDETSAANLTGGEYLQFDASVNKWIATSAISFDISGNSIFDLGDVSGAPAPNTVRTYLAWNDTANYYEASQLDISSDTTPQLGGNLDIGNKYLQSEQGLEVQISNSTDPYFTLAQQNPSSSNVGMGMIFIDRREFGRQVTTIHTAPNLDIYFDQDDQEFKYNDVDIYLPGTPAFENSIIKYDAAGVGTFTSFDLNELNSVEINLATLSAGSVLVYDFEASKWKNQPAAPADISGNSLGQLGDVTFGGTGDLSIENLNSISFNGNRVPGIDTNYINSNAKGFSISQFRTSDGLGSYIYAHKDNGIELNSSASIVRLTGDPLQSDNAPTLRWESDDVVENPLAPYAALALPANYSIRQTYTFPSVAPQAGQALFSDENGVLSWNDVTVDFTDAISLDQLQDVELTTPVPLEGMVLTYTGDPSVGWVAKYPPEQIGNVSDLSDVDLTGLSDNDFLRWNAGTARWEPSEGPEKDWMIESAVQFFLEFNTTVGGTIPVGTWAINSPLIANTTAVSISKFSLNALNLSGQIEDIYDVGRQLLFESQVNEGTYLLCTVTEVISDTGSQIDLGVTLDAFAGAGVLGDKYVLSLVGGGGSGGGGTASSMEDLTDTDFLPIALSNKAILEYEQATGFWKEGDPVARDLGDLSSVDLATEAPEVGENLIWNGANWVPGAGSSGGGVNAKATDRVTLNAAVAGVAPDQDKTVTVTSLGSSGNFLSIEVDQAAWVRCYSSQAALVADSSRLQTEDPVLGDGVLLEFITEGPSSTNVTPGTVYFNSETSPETQDNIYFAVRNLGEATTDINLTVVAYAAIVTALSKGRTSVQDTTPLLASGAAHNGYLDKTGKMGSFISVSTSANAWITFYTSTEARDNDATRGRDTTPSTGSGVLLELITAANTIYEITPQRGYFNNDPLPLDRIHYKVVNESGTDKEIVVKSAIIPLEGQILNAITGSVTTINGGTFG